MADDNGKEPFVPTSREDWVGIFSDGMNDFWSKREEAEAKARAAEGAPNPPPANDGGNDGGEGGAGNAGSSNGDNEKPVSGWQKFTDGLLGNAGRP